MTSSAGTYSTPDIEFLEKKVAANSASPLFARLASLYLDRDRVQSALILCENGIARYPEYATAHLLWAKCLVRLERFEEAKQGLQRTLRLQPHCRVAHDLLQEIGEREEAKAVIEIGRVLDKVSATETAEGGVVPSSTSVEEKIRVMERFGGEQGGTEIATPTLAEIYASQGAFREAIRTYLVLAARKPEERERVEGRIKELKEKWRSLGQPS